MKKDFCCSSAEEAENSIPNQIICTDLADFFKIFGDYTRIRLLFALQSSELCVNDLSLILGMQQSAVSHQLKILKTNKIVSTRKEGKMTFYSLNDQHVSDVLTICFEHLTHTDKEE